MDINCLIGYIVISIAFFYATRPKDNTLDTAWKKSACVLNATKTYDIKIQDFIVLKLASISYERPGSWFTGQSWFIGVFNQWFKCYDRVIL